MLRGTCLADEKQCEMPCRWRNYMRRGFLKRKNMKNELHYDEVEELGASFLLAEKAKKDTMD